MLTSTPPNPTPRFGARPTSASILTNGGVNVTITNKFFNQAAGTEYIELGSFTGNVVITDCDFDTYPTATGAGRRCIYLSGCTGTVVIMRCRARSIPQNFIQFSGSHVSGIIADNCVRGTTANSEDMISMFQSGGVDASHRLQIINNRLDGNVPSTSAPGYVSTTGSGIILGDSAASGATGFIDCDYNSLLNPGATGIAVAGGTDIRVRSNLIWSDPTVSSDVGIYTWNPGTAALCSVIECSQNRVKWTSCVPADNGYFNTGNCGTITSIGCANNFSDSTLNPLKLAVNLK